MFGFVHDIKGQLIGIIKKHGLMVLILAALFVLGNETYRDYGIPWDEKAQIEIARINYNYIVKGSQQLLTFTDRYYGPFFEIGIYHFLKDLSQSDYYYARHLAIYSIHLVGLLAFYFLAYRLLRKSGWALLAVLLLVISPRIFADSLYNVKDIPLMDAFIFAALTIVLLRGSLTDQHKPWLTLLLVSAHGLTTAIALSTRISGLVIVLLTGIVFTLLLLKHPASWKRMIVWFGAYLAMTFSFTVLFWPILWHNPLQQIINALAEMNARPYKSTNLYLGQLIPGQNLPWHYLPVWIGVTTPFIVISGFIVSHLWAVYSAIATLIRKQRDRLMVDPLRNMEWFYVIGWLYLPLAAVIILRTTLYDGWRHVFFIYPAIVLISLWGLMRLWRFISMRPRRQLMGWVAGGILLAGILEPAIFMVRYHPYQNIYFNALAGDYQGMRQRFELDYWGLSYKQALDYILANDPAPTIKINLANSPGKSYIRLMLPPELAKRFKIVDSPERAKYFVSNFRGHPEEYPYLDKYYSINVRGAEIMAVFQLK